MVKTFRNLLFQCRHFIYSQSRRCYSANNENPITRTINVIKNDFSRIKKVLTNESIDDDKNLIPHHCDILVIGGGVMGSSVAFWLKNRAMDGLKVVVVDKDFTVNFFNYNEYQKSSTVLSVGGLRQQFSLKENIELSMKSAEFLRNIKYHLSVERFDPPDIQFNPSGYLFLASDAGAQVLEDNAKLQRSLDAKVELLTPEKLKSKFPWIVTDGISLGCHGLANEGWFDPWSLLTAFRRKAIALGAEYVEAEVIGFVTPNNEYLTDTQKRIEKAIVKLKNGKEEEISFSLCVLASGPQSGAVGKLAGMGVNNFPPLPVEPRKRYVYNIHCPDGPGMLCPLVIDPSGAYFRREGLAGNYLCGKSPLENEEPPVDDLEVDYNYFESQVWPLIASRCPAFENAKLKSAWSGYYDFNAFDENAFIGPHPLFKNLILATGFSGHGIQQSPAVGQAIMELIIDGGYKTVDVTRFHYDRYLDNNPLWESNIV